MPCCRDLGLIALLQGVPTDQYRLLGIEHGADSSDGLGQQLLLNAGSSQGHCDYCLGRLQ